MLDAFRDLLCSKLYWHNRPGPTQDTKVRNRQGNRQNSLTVQPVIAKTNSQNSLIVQSQPTIKLFNCAPIIFTAL